MQFFEALFGGKPDSHFILVWELDGKVSHWFKTITQAHRFVQAHSEKDLYVGCGTASRIHGKAVGPDQTYGRAKPDDIAGIPGLWLDVDLYNPTAHKKENLPKNDEDIQKIISCIPFEPSMVVNSGHGRQLWWIFNEFWEFENQEDREKAASLAERFTRTMKQRAESLGFTIDSTFDLSRIFRIPGTTNTKSTPVAVQLQKLNGVRFVAQDFDDFLIDVLPAKPSTIIQGKLTLNSTAEPPVEKFAILMKNEPRFIQSWEKKRKDMKDQSPSSYDFSLANFALMAGWNHQEVANLIIAWRRKHGEDLKLRLDYYERTIAKAAATIEKDEAVTKLEDLKDDMPPEERRKVILENIGKVLNVPITRIMKYKMDPPEYRLETSRGCISLGPVQNLIEQRMLRTKVAAATGSLIPMMKGPVWEEFAQRLLDACEEVDIGEDATDAGMVKRWLIDYVVDRKLVEDPNQAMKTKNPFLKNNKYYFFLDNLRDWLTMYRKEMMTAKEIGKNLHNFGCKQEVMNFKGNLTRSVWSLSYDHPLFNIIKE